MNKFLRERLNTDWDEEDREVAETCHGKKKIPQDGFLEWWDENDLSEFYGYYYDVETREVL